MRHDVEIVQAEHGHWRWSCSCGRKGIRLMYREHVESLGEQHVRREINRSLREIERRLDRYTDMPMCHISCETTYGQQPT